MTEQQWRDAFDWLVDRAELGGVPMETPEGDDMDVSEAVIDWLRSLRYPVPPELVPIRATDPPLPRRNGFDLLLLGERPRKDGAQ